MGTDEDNHLLRILLTPTRTPHSPPLTMNDELTCGIDQFCLMNILRASRLHNVNEPAGHPRLRLSNGNTNVAERLLEKAPCSSLTSNRWSWVLNRGC